MLGILETESVRDLADGLLRVEHVFLCRFQCFLLDVFQGGLTRFFLQQIAQVIGRQAEFVGAVLYGRQSFRGGPVGMEILVQQTTEAGGRRNGCNNQEAA